MSKKNLLENYIYNTLFQVFRVISPVITIPYITRVLSSEGIGAFAYTNSITNIFILCGALGITSYGARSIAYGREDFDKRSRLFWELFFQNLLTNLIVLVFFLVYIQFSPENLKQLYYIQILLFATSIFEIAWYFIGQEDFKKTSARLFLTRFIGIIAIFLFVKTKNDLALYTFIISFSGFLGCIFLWYQMRNEIRFVLPEFKKVLAHLVPTFNMFASIFATYVFVVIDKIMVGNIVGLSEAGIYEMADRLIKVVIPLAISLGPVMMPRIANSIANKDFDKINFYLTKSFAALSYISIPICIGIIATSNQFIPWFLGEDFRGSAVIINILAFTIILNAWKSVANVQVLIPFGKEKTCALIIFLGLVLKVLLNIAIIPVYKGLGAAISTLMAEIFITWLFLYYASPFMNLKGFYKEFFTELFKFCLAAVMFYIPVKIIGNVMGIGYLTTIIQVITGVAVYFGSVAILKSSTHRFIQDKIMNILLKRFSSASEPEKTST